MFSLRFVWLAQLCILPILIQSYPHGSIEKLVQEYMEGITKLKTTPPHEETSEKSAELEIAPESEEYDFIIIGGGTSGSTIANRLTEVPEWHVLLLESGKEENKIGKIPAMAEILQNSQYNWGYKMEPQHHNCLGMVNHQCPVISGKGLGGTSSINSMLYSRGNPLDYDRWADEHLKSWCYDHILPYFKKSEDVALEHFDNKYHSKGGPIHVENVQYQGPLVESFLEAGHKTLEAPSIDYNGRQQLGFGLTQAMTALGKRRSTASGFIAPAAHRKNLIIQTDSHVTEILIGDHTHEVKGVKYIKDGKIHVAKAKKEVILSAGLFNSPHLLMQSGVGPKTQLEKHGIPIKVELEGVGKNLQDHMQFLGLNFLINETETLGHQATLEDNLKTWLTEGKGPLTKTQDIEAIGYIKTKASKEDKDYPDIELQFQSRHFDKEQGEILKQSLGLDTETYESIWKPLESHYIYSINPILLHPKSRGEVELLDKHEPKINGNHFTDADDHDIETMVQGIKVALEISKSEPFQKWGSKLAEVQVPGCDNVHEHGSDDYWKCCVRRLTVPHPQSGTCKMGLKTDKTAVVDEQLKVHGVQGLRVADNSVIPDALSGHSTAATIMIGEKAADMIKESWK